MKNEILRENIESLEKVVKNLKDYMVKQEGLIEQMKTDVCDTEETVHWLEELIGDYTKDLEKKNEI